MFLSIPPHLFSIFEKGLGWVGCVFLLSSLKTNFYHGTDYGACEQVEPQPSGRLDERWVLLPKIFIHICIFVPKCSSESSVLRRDSTHSDTSWSLMPKKRKKIKRNTCWSLHLHVVCNHTNPIFLKSLIIFGTITRWMFFRKKSASKHLPAL